MPLPLATLPAEKLPVAFTALGVKRLIEDRIDVALPAEQIDSAEVSAEYIQPLILEIEKHFLDDAIFFNLMSCRLHYLNFSNSGPPSTRKLMRFRAIVADEIASQISHDLDSNQLPRALVYEFYPLNQGDSSFSTTVPAYYRASALELAVETRASAFLMEPPITDTIKSFWDGVVSIEKGASVDGCVRLEDTMTHVQHNRTTHSPSYHYVMQLVSAAFFLVLYLMLIQEDPTHPSKAVEFLFGLWSLGYALDEYNQMVEFGPHMYFMSLWNWIDLILVAHSALYFSVRFISWLLPNVLPRSFMLARGVLVTAGLFVVPRLFSVFDSNKIFSNMVFSLQRVSSDLIVSWCVVMMFSVGVWVAVAFSVPRVRLSSDTVVAHGGENQENGASRTALAMFKMLFGDNDSLWDKWFAYTAFDKIALGFYLILAQFVMPTVVTAVLASSFASVQKESEEQYYYMRAVQTLQKLKSNRKQRASSSEVTPFNVISWVFEWLDYLLPESVYQKLSSFFRMAFHLPGILGSLLWDQLRVRRQTRANKKAEKRQKRLEDEVERTMGNESIARVNLKHAERRMAKFSLINETFTNKKLTHAYESSRVAHALSTENEQETSKTILTRIVELEKSSARIENLLEQLVKK